MGLNRGTHASEACTLPFKADRDRPRSAGYPQLTDRITLSDRNVLRRTRAEPPLCAPADLMVITMLAIHI
jgi:hypothetical protein